MLPGDVLSGLPRLRVLRLDGNRLADPWDAADKLAGLPALTAVSLTNNPATRRGVPHRPLLIARCGPALALIDGVEVSEEERACVEAAGTGSAPQSPASAAAGGALSARARLGDGYDAATALLVAAADSRAAMAAAAGGSSGSDRVAGSPRASPQQPRALACDALAALAVRHGLGGVSGSGALFTPSVPSIQSGVLLLTGAGGFGLAGTAIGGGRSGSGDKPAPAHVAQAGGRRTTTGSVPGNNAPGTGAGAGGPIVSSRAGGFVVRQATFH